LKIRTKTKFTHILISDNTQKHLNQLKAIGQSYDGFIQKLIARKEVKWKLLNKTG